MTCQLCQSSTFQLITHNGETVLGGRLTCGCPESGGLNCLATMLQPVETSVKQLYENGYLGDEARDASGMITVEQKNWHLLRAPLSNAWKKQPGPSSQSRGQRHTIVLSKRGAYLHAYVMVLAIVDADSFSGKLQEKLLEKMKGGKESWMPWFEKEVVERLLLTLADGHDKLATSLDKSIKAIQAGQFAQLRRLELQELATFDTLNKIKALSGNFDEKMHEKMRDEGVELLGKMRKYIEEREKVQNAAFSQDLTEKIQQVKLRVSMVESAWSARFDELAAAQTAALAGVATRLDESDQRHDRNEAQMERMGEQIVELIDGYAALKKLVPPTVGDRLKACLSPVPSFEDSGAPEWLIEAAEIVKISPEMDPVSVALRSPAIKARAQSPDTVTSLLSPIVGALSPGLPGLLADDAPVQQVAREPKDLGSAKNLEASFLSPQASAAEPGPSTMLARGDDSPASAEEHVRGDDAPGSAEEPVRGGETSGSAEEPVRGGETSASAEEPERGGEAPMDRKILEMVDAKPQMVDAKLETLVDAKLQKVDAKLDEFKRDMMFQNMMFQTVLMLVSVMVLIYFR